MRNLEFYLRRILKLNRATVSGDKAPHKPILLLAVIRQLQIGSMVENRISITPQLVADFRDLWHQLVDSKKFTPNFSLPFYHLQSSGFWHLQTKPGSQMLKTSSNSIRSFSHLKEVIDYAYLDNDLFNLLTDKHNSEVLRQTLLTVYFPKHHSVSSENLLVRQIQQEILHEPAKTYQSRAIRFDEEEVFVRCGVFKREVPKIYNYTCSISGMRIIVDNIQMIDACHIIPFAESHDDTISNGISLCPNLHRAFDRGILSINSEYRVVFKSFSESDGFYTMKQFEGREILLPKNKSHFPAQRNLAVHRERFGF